ncbi:MAG: cobalamin-binding protein [Planctomycetaceae bacterium]|nr:cobalamin-binding protein [Planctomycetaceae bacterium]
MNKSIRIVSLISSATEILFGLGLDEQTVAISHECDYPSQWDRKPRLTLSHIDSTRPSAEIDEQVQRFTKIGSALYSIDLPTLLALKPDLIITQDQCDVCAVPLDDVLQIVQNHQELQHTHVLTMNPSSINDVLDDIGRIGKATHTSAQAASWIDQLQSRIRTVRDTTENISRTDRPRTICIEWVDPVMLAANWTPEIIEWAGGINGLTEGGQHSQWCDWNQVIKFNPDLIIVSPCGFDLSRTLIEAQTLPTQPSWKNLNAVKTNRVFAIDGNAYLNRSGPRLVDTLEILASIFHASVFPPVHTHAVCPLPAL